MKKFGIAHEYTVLDSSMCHFYDEATGHVISRDDCSRLFFRKTVDELSMKDRETFLCAISDLMSEVDLLNQESNISTQEFMDFPIDNQGKYLISLDSMESAIVALQNKTDMAHIFDRIETRMEGALLN